MFVRGAEVTRPEVSWQEAQTLLKEGNSQGTPTAEDAVHMKNSFHQTAFLTLLNPKGFSQQDMFCCQSRRLSGVHMIHIIVYIYYCVYIPI